MPTIKIKNELYYFLYKKVKYYHKNKKEFINFSNCLFFVNGNRSKTLF